MMDDKIPPIVHELFNLLPTPGSEWSLVDRLRWMDAATAIFKVIYLPDVAQSAIDGSKKS